MTSETPTLVGSILGGRYEVVRRVGGGGMGVVYEARHTVLGRRLAVKVLKSELAASEAALARFRREARASAAIRHPHIVDVVDYGVTDDGAPYIVMEFLEGEDLAALLGREGRLPVGRAVGIARQVARGLSAAHAAGIVHRDLKTENVFLLSLDERDFAKILDFGIARSLVPDEDSRLTATGMVLGTPHYMSPEAARGRLDLDGRADVYSLGVILYEMLVGQVPFHGGALLEVVYRQIHEEPVAPRISRPDARVPSEVEAVVMRALEKEPDRRWQTPEDMIQALPDPAVLPGGERAGPLIGVAASSTPTPRPAGSTPPTRRTEVLSDARPRRGYGMPMVAVVAALLLGAGAVWATFWRDVPARRTEEAPPRRALSPRTSSDRGAAGSEPSAPPANVTYRVRSIPPGARVEVDGRDVGRTPVEADVPRLDGEARIVILGDDGTREERTISRLADADIEVVLGHRSEPERERAVRPPEKTPRTRPVTAAGSKTATPRDLRPNPYGR